jgi:hypothetical protein
VIDSRDFLAAKRRVDNEVILSAGPKIAVTGGLGFNDHRLIWDRLDKVYAKHPDMVLVHGGSPKVAELIAGKWATNRKVPQIAFKPDSTKHGKAAPFKRGRDARDAADRRHGVLRLGHPGQSRRKRQGSSASRSGNSAKSLPPRRRGCRVSAVSFLGWRFNEHEPQVFRRQPRSFPLLAHFWSRFPFGSARGALRHDRSFPEQTRNASS